MLLAGKHALRLLQPRITAELLHLRGDPHHSPFCADGRGLAGPVEHGSLTG